MPILIGVSRVAPYDEAMQDHSGCSSGKKHLMTILRVSFSFDDDVGMVLKEGTYLFRCRNLLFLEDSPVGLIDDFCEDGHCPFEPSGQFSSREGVGKGMAFIGG